MTISERLEGTGLAVGDFPVKAEAWPGGAGIGRMIDTDGDGYISLAEVLAIPAADEMPVQGSIGVGGGAAIVAGGLLLDELITDGAGRRAVGSAASGLFDFDGVAEVGLAIVFVFGGLGLLAWALITATKRGVNYADR